MTTSAYSVRQFFDLVVALAWRDVRVRYKQSLLGLSWAVLVPVCTTVVFAAVFRASGVTVRLPGGMPYAVFALSGLAPWMFFANSLNACVNCLTSNRSLVTKVYFPREALPLGCILAALMDFTISLGVLGIVACCWPMRGDFGFHWTPWLLASPLVLVVLVLYAVSAGLLTSLANVFWRDVRQVLVVGMPLLMFASGVVLPFSKDSEVSQWLCRLNPLAAIFAAFRNCVIFGTSPFDAGFGVAAGLGVFLLLASWWSFRRVSQCVAEVV